MSIPHLPDVKFDSSSVMGSAKPTYNYSHIFSEHFLRGSLNKEVLAPKSDLWPSYFIFFGFFLLLISFLSISRKINLLVKSCFSLQSSRTLRREEFRIVSKESFFMSLIYLFGLSFLLYKFNGIFNFFPFFEDQLFKFLAILFFVFGVYVCKLFFLWLSGFFLDYEKAIDEYRYNLFIAAHISGALLLLLAVFLEFVQISDLKIIPFGFFVLFSLYAFRITKGILIAKEIRNFTGFQLFVYLCGLEILPICVLVSFLSRLSSYVNFFK